MCDNIINNRARRICAYVIHPQRCHYFQRSLLQPLTLQARIEDPIHTFFFLFAFPFPLLSDVSYSESSLSEASSSPSSSFWTPVSCNYPISNSVRNTRLYFYLFTRVNPRSSAARAKGTCVPPAHDRQCSLPAKHPTVHQLCLPNVA